jgi:hypothetical protein
MGIKKSSEKIRFFPFEQALHNKFMLWYPVPQTALAHYLREGLQLPAQEIPAATFKYGKGLYFYDSASKAVHSNPPKGDFGYLLLCEVALGDMHPTSKSYQFTKPPGTSHSVYGIGQLKPKLIGIRDLNRP